MSDEKDPIRVVVCGTTFGRVYMNGIKKLNSNYLLVGILSRGSKQSKQCAEEYNVPLYTSVDDINKSEVDLVCVVVRSGIVGGKGTDIALELLKKGINVIQEQPVHYGEIVECYKTANKFNCKYLVNTFYPYLKNVSSFISTANLVLKNTSPVYIDASCSLQVLFPLLDILGKMMGGFNPFSIINKMSIQNDIFILLSGELKGVPIAIRVQNQIAANNPDNYFHFLHKITLGTESGSLIMTDTNGPILWNPRFFVPHDDMGILNLYNDSKYLNLPVTEFVEPPQNITYKNIYEDMWPEGISNALMIFKDVLEKDKNDRNIMQYYLSLCNVWNLIGEAIGASNEINPSPIAPLMLKELRDAN